jgi:hypothetical protein
MAANDYTRAVRLRRAPAMLPVALALLLSVADSSTASGAGNDAVGEADLKVAELLSREPRAAANSCSDYRAHLARARSYLERGERAGALAELRRARALLQSCLRDHAPEAVAAG